MRTRIKVCGITREEDARMAAESGVDAVGVILTESPRRVTPDRASAIRAVLPEDVKLVGVFANEPPDEVDPLARSTGLDAVQVAGWLGLDAERPYDVWHVVREATLPDPMDLPMVPLRTYLLDAHDPARAGGSGKRADWDWAKRCVELGRRLIVAGGLTPENVAGLVLEVRPFGVDASSGLESAVGRKSPDLVREFIARVRAADRERPKRS
jgi:phosphoribosylanthranilate isomerase